MGTRRGTGIEYLMPWSVVVPVKALHRGKSRLMPAGDPWREDLAIAFLSDVLAGLQAASRVSETLVVSDDPIVRAIAGDAGARPIPEPAAPGINPAATEGIRRAGTGLHVAVIVGDLPCLDAAAVDVVLAQAREFPRSFVCDAIGTGTTMLMALDRADCMPQFGGRSRARHAAGGNIELGQGAQQSGWREDAEAFRRARRDVDTVVDLWDAVRIGVGPATRSTLLQREEQIPKA